MALFGSSPAAPVTTKPVQRIGSLPTAPAPTTLGLGTPTPPPGAVASAAAGVPLAQTAAAKQKKIAAAGSPLVGGPTSIALPTAQVQPKTLLGR